ncbi:MAG: hypothetical protein JNK27_07330 [Chitinophagaceae bacterium]|nr:hypothetical protein [Chitinophagaceae bacterium]
MKRKNYLLFSLLTVFLTAALVILSSSSSTEKTPKQAVPTCCKKTKVNCTETKKEIPADLMLESLSRQFISISSF